MHYEDFVLQLEASSRGGYSARVLKSPFGEGATSFVLPAIAQTGLAGGIRLRAPEDDPSPPAADPRRVEPSPTEIGTELYRAVFQGPVRSLLDKSRGQLERSPQSGLRLKIKLDLGDPDTAALADLPWELLCDSETEDFFALSRQTSLVRYLDVPRMSQPIPFTPPLRILAVSASPDSMPPLDLAEEARRLEALRQSGLPIEVKHLVNASAGAMREALVSGTWHVMHFMGHGHFDRATGEGMLAFERADGRGDLVSGRAFATKLKDLSSLGVVVLNACNTARAGRQGEVNPFHGVATALVLGGVRAVVAMQRPIPDRAAIAFSTAFYRHLARGDSIDEALIEGRQAIHSAAPETFAWAIPVLFLRTPEGNVFTAQPNAAVPPQPTAAEPARPGGSPAPGVRGKLLRIGAGAGVAGLIAYGISAGIGRSPQAPAPDLKANAITLPPVPAAGPTNPTHQDPAPPKTSARAHSQSVDRDGQSPSTGAASTKPGGDDSNAPAPAPTPAPTPADLSNLSAQAIAISPRANGGLSVTASFRNSGSAPLSLTLDLRNAQLSDDQGETYLAVHTTLPLAAGNPRLDLAPGASKNAQFDFPKYRPGSKTFGLSLVTTDKDPIFVSGKLPLPLENPP